MEKNFKCDNCGHTFSEYELKKTKTTWEQYYGVASLFPNGNELVLCVCPKCDSDEIHSIEE